MNRIRCLGLAAAWMVACEWNGILLADPGWYPQSFSRTLDYGGGVVTQQVRVWNPDYAMLYYNLTVEGTGLSFTVESGECAQNTTNTHELVFNPNNVRAGRYTGTVTLAAAGFDPLTGPVAFTVRPVVRFREDYLTNSATYGNNANAQNVHVTAEGDPTFGITYAMTPVGSWLSVTPTQAVSIGQENSFQVIYSSSTLQPGVYPGAIRAVPVGFPEAAASLSTRLDIPPPAGGFQERIVFSSNRGGDMDIYSMLPDGLDILPLVQRTGEQLHPRLSPNGTMLAFRDSSSGNWELRVIRFSDSREWTLRHLEEFEWLPDGSGLAGVESIEDVGADILAVPLEANPYTLVHDSGRQALWACDAAMRQAIYTTDPGDWSAVKVLTKHLDTGSKGMIMAADGRTRRHGDTSPDGQRLVYERSMEAMPYLNRIVARGRAYEDSETEISNTKDAESDQTPRFSPAGDTVVFARTKGKSAMSILTVPVSGGGEDPLLNDDFYNHDPDWGWILINEEAAPVINVSHNDVSGRTAPDGMSSKSISIWNSGTGPLHYQVAFAPAWITVEPSSGVSRGAQNPHTIFMSATGLTHGTYNGAVQFTSDGGDVWVNVQLDVIATNAYSLTVTAEPDELGDVQVAPVPGPDGKYAAGQYIVLTAVPVAGAQFRGWQGGGLNGNALETNLTLNGDQVVVAQFFRDTTLSGTISNRVTGALLAGAEVQHGASTNLSGSAPHYGGWYRLTNLVCGQTGPLQVNLNGFEPYTDWSYSPACETDSTRDIGLQPNLVRNVRATQRPGSMMVDISYDLIAPGGWTPRVLLDIATMQPGQYEYSNFTDGVTGQIGNRVSPGLNRTVTLDASRLWRYNYARTNATVRLRCEGGEAVSPGFRLYNSHYTAWDVTIWADRNENNLFDSGEQLEGAELYYGGRTPAHRLGLTDGWGRFLVTNWIEEGAVLFARKKVHTVPSYKPGHEAVDNTMFSLWLDTDIGGPENSNWDGTWRSYTMTTGDVAQAHGGFGVYVRANHPLFECNLLVHGEFHWGVWFSRFTNGFNKASEYLYDATDGQMKLGKVAIVTDMRPRHGDPRWHNADIVVFDWLLSPATNSVLYPTTNAPSEFWPGASLNGIDKIGDHHICFGLRWSGAYPEQPGYYTTIIHELGHYAFSLYDEYLNGRGEKDEWFAYRATNPTKCPINYGIMQHQYDSSEFSSYNDYLPSYINRNPLIASMQIYGYYLVQPIIKPFYPCWALIKDSFTGKYSGYDVNIIAPRYGTFAVTYAGSPPVRVETPTSLDRPGPYRIPAPYEDCTFPLHPWPRAGAETEVPSNKGLITLSARNGVQPASGAMMLVKQSSGRVLRAGRTDGNGRLEWLPFAAGDSVRALWNGREATVMIGAEQAGQDISLDFSEASRRASEAESWRSGALSTTNFGLVMCGDFDAEARLSARLYGSMDYAAAPTGTVECADTNCSAPLAFSLSSGQLATALVQLTTAPYGGHLNLSASATSGQSQASILTYSIVELVKEDINFIRSQDGSLLIITEPDQVVSTTRLFMGQSSLPPPAPFDDMAQVGPVLLLAADGIVSNLALNWSYPDADLAGVDELSLYLARWEESTKEWIAVEDQGVSHDDNRVSATLTNLGAFALFGIPSSDVNSPDPVTNLVVTVSGDHVLLYWTSPSDDPPGPVMRYLLKSASEFITPETWDAAREHFQSMAPAEPGQPENTSVNLPETGGNYFFAIRSLDSAGNLSDLSNVAAVQAPVRNANADGLPQQWIDSVSRGGTIAVGLNDDADRDGLTTEEEFLRDTDPGCADTDGDGMDDGYEVERNLNPNSAADGEEDADGDNLTNEREAELMTNPHAADTDGDTYEDDEELSYGSDPRNYYSSPGTLRVFIQPEEAIADGARWRVTTGLQTNWMEHTNTLTLGTGTYTVAFLRLSSWTKPASQAVTIYDGTETTSTGLYLPPKMALPWLILMQ